MFYFKKIAYNIVETQRTEPTYITYIGTDPMQHVD